ncbi:hypothetical protein ABGB17_08355 [Sphaerisporangium sp. B11E5]|uniref:hypothetical protein n=1 Tax=Sphaerisporangium sp. B11E5 TaxID=3153563 RepID=UPI00325DD3B0
MDPIVLAAGTALITAIATDAWEQARTGVVTLWRRVRPEEAAAVERELTEARAEVLACREEGDTEAETTIAEAWQVRLQRLLREDPTMALELRRLLGEVCAPPPAAPPPPAPVVLNATATASGNARVYQSAGDQHITER